MNPAATERAKIRYLFRLRDDQRHDDMDLSHVDQTKVRKETG